MDLHAVCYQPAIIEYNMTMDKMTYKVHSLILSKWRPGSMTVEEMIDVILLAF